MDNLYDELYNYEMDNLNDIFNVNVSRETLNNDNYDNGGNDYE